jgi:hypothetical protein
LALESERIFTDDMAFPNAGVAERSSYLLSIFTVVSLVAATWTG